MGQGEGMGGGAGGGAGGSTGTTGSGGTLWMVIWLVLLIFAGIWVAGFCAWWYIMLIPFTVCVPVMAGVTDILLRGTQLTYFCAKNMMEKNTLSEALAGAAATVPPTVIAVQGS